MHQLNEELRLHYVQVEDHLPIDDEQHLVCQSGKVRDTPLVLLQIPHCLLHHTHQNQSIHHNLLIYSAIDPQRVDILRLEYHLDFVEFEAISNVRIQNRLRHR